MEDKPIHSWIKVDPGIREQAAAFHEEMDQVVVSQLKFSRWAAIWTSYFWAIMPAVILLHTLLPTRDPWQMFLVWSACAAILMLHAFRLNAERESEIAEYLSDRRE